LTLLDSKTKFIVTMSWWTRLVFVVLTLSLGAVRADDSVLMGKMVENRYTAPSGSYSITLPIQLELGGVVTDTKDVVTFQDEFRIHASIACFKMGSSHQREIQTRGRRDFLISFFREQVHTQFKRRFPGAEIDEARYMPEVLGEALLVYNTLPDGSMFSDQTSVSSSQDSVVLVKRGNLLFLKDQHLYVISVELAKFLLGDKDSPKFSEEEKRALLRKELLDLAGRITFL